MILADTGPLVAMIDRNDPDHALCVATLAKLRGPLISTLPVLTEAMYLLGRNAGWAGQERLWSIVTRNTLQVAFLDTGILTRIRFLMEKYRDVPMDFSDASLVAIAEAERIDRIFTLDSHFYAYRLKGRRSFDVIPTGNSA